MTTDDRLAHLQADALNLQTSIDNARRKVDEARAEAVRKVLHDETGGCTCHSSYVARRLEDPGCVWHDIERAIPDVIAAATPAEPTTEDAQTGTFETILAAHREEYDSDCGMYYGCYCGWDNDDTESNEGYVEHVAGLLARPAADTRDIARVLEGSLNIVGPLRHIYLPASRDDAGRLVIDAVEVLLAQEIEHAAHALASHFHVTEKGTDR